MIREALPQGWRLIRHQDHARLAADFARFWGNSVFLPPQPFPDVIMGIACHDDGWVARDQEPLLTRQGKPSAFSSDLVGKYSAFEEIDLADYLSVRGRALEVIAERNAYAAVLVSSHTHNLLSARADRSTIRPADLPLLDDFIAQQERRRSQLVDQLRQVEKRPAFETAEETLQNGFRLLQACDCLSLLSCVGWTREADLLHPLPCHDGTARRIEVTPVGPRCYRLSPYPLQAEELCFQVSSRVLERVNFSSQEEFAACCHTAPEDVVTLTLTA